jgi:hypothetical protein
MMRIAIVVFALTPRLITAQACVTGRVVDAAGLQPIKGVAVSASWAEARSQRVQSSKTTTSDSSGRFRLCLRPGASLLLQASLGSSGAYLPFVAPAGDSTLPDVRLPAESDSGQAIVSGHVLSESGAPVAGAVVTLLGGRLQTLTGSDGSYGLRGVSGSQVLIVRQVGLGAAIVPVALSSAQPQLTNVTMQRAPATLPVVNVMAERKRFAAVYDAIGFTKRQGLGHGHFLTFQDIDAKHASETPDLMRGIPGVVIKTDHNNVQRIFSDRGASTLESYGACTAYIVDGALVGNGRAVYTLDAVSGLPDGPEDETSIPSPANLIAIEVYQPGEPAPIADAGIDRCLKVVLWTKSVMGHTQ